jgi:predicted amidohydrolase YtcJ
MTLKRTLFANGRILTGVGLLTADPQLVEALLVEDGVIVAAGATKTLQATGSPALIDLKGAFCMPGFNDAHLHLGEGARLHREVDLRGTRSLEEALQRIERRVLAEDANAQETVWLSGGGWDETLWADAEQERRLPTRHALDRVTGDHPAVFARIDVHVSVANSAALRLAGVDRHTVAPGGSTIDHDAHGEPTGILREQGARALVEHLVPPATQVAREQSLRAVLGLACAQGITSVQDNSVDADFAALRALHARGEQTLRVSEWLPFDAPVEELKERQNDAPQDRFLRTGMLKAFLDGSLGSRTAALNAPYSDAGSSSGLTFYDRGTLNAMARKRAEAGFSLGFHAIGDRAFAMALAAFEFAAGGQAAGDKKPFRIEHAQVATTDAYPRMKALGAIASIQPCHLLSDAAWALDRLGAGRAAHAYAWRRFLEAGVPLALGTDFPVEPVDPFRNLYAAIVPASETAGTWFPGQRLTLAEALHAYTGGSALAEGTQSWKGVLAPGYAADFIVLDRDLLACAGNARAIRETRVMRTVINGRSVFERLVANPGTSHG